MTREEFTIMTGIYPDITLYAEIEAQYMRSGMTKQKFAKAYADNMNGLADHVAICADLQEERYVKSLFDKLEEQSKQIELLQKENQQLQQENDREREWTYFLEKSRCGEEKYQNLRNQSDTKILTETEAAEKVAEEFGFNKDKITIHTEIPRQIKDRHGYIKTVKDETGHPESIERLPLYNATDWNYIAFAVASIEYEMVDGDLHQIDQ